MLLVSLAGYLAIVYSLYKIVPYIAKYARAPLAAGELGDWALVTGATDGIGRTTFL